MSDNQMGEIASKYNLYSYSKEEARPDAPYFRTWNYKIYHDGRVVGSSNSPNEKLFVEHLLRLISTIPESKLNLLSRVFDDDGLDTSSWIIYGCIYRLSMLEKER